MEWGEEQRLLQLLRLLNDRMPRLTDFLGQQQGLWVDVDENVFNKLVCTCELSSGRRHGVDVSGVRG
jgi:hypothetical protein